MCSRWWGWGQGVIREARKSPGVYVLWEVEARSAESEDAEGAVGDLRIEAEGVKSFIFI